MLSYQSQHAQLPTLDMERERERESIMQWLKRCAVGREVKLEATPLAIFL